MSILHFFDFSYLMNFSTGNTIQTHSFYFLFPLYIRWHSKTKVSQLTYLFAVLYLSLLKSIAALKFHTFCNSFMTKDLNFYINTSFIYILHRQLIRISYPPFWIFVIEPCNYITAWCNA